MKIYCKTTFRHGLFFYLFGVFDLIWCFVVGFRPLLILSLVLETLIGTVLLYRALSSTLGERDRTEHWGSGETTIYNKGKFLSGVLLLTMSPIALDTFLNGGVGVGFVSSMVVLFWAGANAVLRSMSLEESQKDIIEERDERNKLVILKTQAMSFQITQLVCLLLMCFFFLKGGYINKLDLDSAGVGAFACLLAAWAAEFFTRKYYEKHL